MIATLSIILWQPYFWISSMSDQILFTKIDAFANYLHDTDFERTFGKLIVIVFIKPCN